MGAWSRRVTALGRVYGWSVTRDAPEALECHASKRQAKLRVTIHRSSLKRSVSDRALLPFVLSVVFVDEFFRNCTNTDACLETGGRVNVQKVV